MNKNYFLTGLVSSLALLATFQAAPAQEASDTEIEPAFRMENFFPPRPRMVMSDEYHQVEWIKSNAAKQLAKGEYDELEKTAQDFRTTKKIYSTGNWQLTAFYEAVTSYGDNDPGDNTIALLKKWVQARPQSITAHVALAAGLVNYAWTARGYSSGNNVPSAAVEAFQERLDQARAVLREAKNLPDKDPHWWRVTQSVALGQEWDKTTYDGLYKEAIAFEPTYTPYYFAKANFLLNRWYGELGDPEKFAAEAADTLGKLKGQAQGDALYARLFWNFEHNHYQEISFGVPALTSIERIERGMKELARQYPQNATVQGAWLQLYYRSQNPAYKQQARQVLLQTRNRVDPWVWHNMEEYYSTSAWVTRP